MFRHKKSLGQNFLHNNTIAQKICNSAILEKQHVIEIGCGKGILTRQILAQNPSKLTIIELDERCINYVKESLPEYLNKVVFFNQNALDIPISSLNIDSKPIVISNLPYNVGTRIFINLLHEAKMINSMILMFQKEVAQRIVARYNTPEYSLLSFLSQVSCECKILFDVSPNNFTPPPKITSSVVQIIPNNNVNISNIIEEARNLFSNKRKILSKKIMHNTILQKTFGTMRIQELTVLEILSLINNIQAKSVSDT